MENKQQTNGQDLSKPQQPTHLANFSNQVGDYNSSVTSATVQNLHNTTLSTTTAKGSVGLKNLEFPRAVLAQANSGFVQSGDCSPGDIFDPVDSVSLYEKPGRKSKGKSCYSVPIYMHEITWFKEDVPKRPTVGVKLGHYFQAQDKNNKPLLCYRGHRVFFAHLSENGSLKDEDSVPFSASLISANGGPAGRKLAAHFSLCTARNMAPWNSFFEVSSKDFTSKDGNTFHCWNFKKAGSTLDDKGLNEWCAKWAPILVEYSQSYGESGAQASAPVAPVAPQADVLEDDVPF